jgi:hypothetical protein
MSKTQQTTQCAYGLPIVKNPQSLLQVFDQKEFEI